LLGHRLNLNKFTQDGTVPNKKSKILTQFLTLVALVSPSFQIAAIIRNLEKTLQNGDWPMSLPNMVQFGPLNSKKNPDNL